MLRLLTFSTLFPNREQPNHGIFVENRLRNLLATGQAESTVIAPIPWFPSGAAMFGRWSRFARVPRYETRHGLSIHHPRFLAVPWFGMAIAPELLYLAGRREMQRLTKNGMQIDAIDAHYFYPDGVAAVWLGADLGLPVVVTARGSDVTQFPDHRVPRRLIQNAMRNAAALITVNAALRDELVRLGAAPEAVTVLRNGVDITTFRPVDRHTARAELGLKRPTLISVGSLIERKRHHLTIEALLLLPEFELLIIGDGPERARLSVLAERLGVASRVRLLGAKPHARLRHYYCAADISVLASSREGWANVLLESMACGTPVVASDIPGNSEVVQERVAGLIMQHNTCEGLAAAVQALWSDLPCRAATRAYSERFRWDETSRGQLALFRQVVDGGR